MARDRPKPAQEKVVALRSGNICAYPGCGAELVLEARSKQDQDKAVGRAAHIAAASPGGPRHDPSMTSEERGSADNLMFLCSPHHDGIDTQLHLHTTEFLLSAKRKHEAQIARACRYSIGEVGFDYLEVVCKALALDDVQTEEPVALPLEIDDKIEINKLSDSARKKILTGIASFSQVEKFITMMTAFKPDFGNRLAAGFKKIYYGGVADGLKKDELFDFVHSSALAEAGPVNNDALQVAVLSVVAYLFSLCEIFEHESSAA